MTVQKRWLILVFSLWFFPSLFFWAGFGVFFRLTEEEAIRQTQQSLTNRLEEIARKSDEKTFWETHIRRDFEGLFQTPVQTPAFKKEWGKILKKYPPGMIRIIACDQTGNVLSGEGSHPLTSFLPALQYLQTVSLENLLFFKSEEKIFGSYFYHRKEVFQELGRNVPGTLVRPFIRPGQPPSFPHGIIHLMEERPSPGCLKNMLVMIFQAEAWPDFISDSLVKSEQTPSVKLGYCDNSGKFLMPDSLEMTGENFLVLNRNQVSPDFAVGQTRIKTLRLEGQTLLIGASIPNNPWRSVVIICMIVFFPGSFFLLIFLFRQAEKQQLTLSLEGKILALFLLGVLLPAGISSALAQWYVREKRKEVFSEIQKSANRGIENIERGFETFCRNMEIGFHDLEREFRNNSSGLERIRQKLEQLFKERKVEDAYIISSSGKIAQDWHQPNETLEIRMLDMPREKRIPIMKRWLAAGYDLSHLAINYFLNPLKKGIKPETRGILDNAEFFNKGFGMIGSEVCKEEDRRNGIVRQNLTAIAEEAVKGMLTGEVSDLFDAIRTKLRSMTSYSYRGGEGYLYPSILMNSMGEAEYALILLFSQEAMEEDYFSELFQSKDSEKEISHLVAIPSSKGLRNQGFPMDAELRDLTPLTKKMEKTLSLAWSGQTTINGKPCEVIIRQVPLIRKYCLAQVIPLEEIERQLEPFIRQAIAFWCGSLLFGICLVIILGKKLLDPILLLVNGIQAIKDKKLDFTLPVLSNDELGILSQEFNRTLVHLREMEVAKIIQTSLYPQRQITLGKYEILGKNQMTQAIGGDYFDYFPIGDNFLAFVLADVSGHGISAALVTAMAKAAVTILYSQPESSPTKVIQKLHEQFLNILNKKKMMTCFSGILDTRTGKALVINAGQCFPLLISENGQVDYVEMAGSPMGIMKKPKFFSGEIELSNKTLLLYSDCFIESLNEKGEMIDVTNLKAITEKLVQEVKNWGPDELFERVREFTGSVPWNDDATAVLIRPVKADHK